MPIQIFSHDDIERASIDTGMQHYVYVLYKPLGHDNIPFYVGIGKGDRIFAHEEEARDPSKNNEKLNTIRKIWERREEVIRFIDSFHKDEPWEREAELINKWGLRKDGTGNLANEQRYAPSNKVDSIELRKYVDLGNQFPHDFKYRQTRLMVGTAKPKKVTSVFGKIYQALKENPGITGEELVSLLLTVDFSRIKSAYTKSGEVSIPWLCGYIDGGFYKKNKYIREFSGN